MFKSRPIFDKHTQRETTGTSVITGNMIPDETGASDDTPSLHYVPCQLLSRPSWRIGLRVADTILGFAIFTPATITYWRGVWGLFDLYVLPNAFYAGSWLSFGIAVIYRVIRVCFEPQIKKAETLLRSGKEITVYKIIFFSIDGIMMMAQWRGLYNVFDHFTGYDMHPNLFGLGVSILILVLTKTLSSTIGGPGCLVVDSMPDWYVCHTRFRTKVSKIDPLTINYEMR